MIQGSASPGPALWLQRVCEILIVGLEPYTPRVAHDGLLGREAAASTVCTAAFAGRVIARSDVSGDFVADGWTLGMTATIAGSLDNNGTAAAVEAITATTLTFTRAIGFSTEGPSSDVSIVGSVPDSFALYVGSQHLDRWTGADVATIVQAEGDQGARMSLGKHGQRVLHRTYNAVFEVHIWGAEIETKDVRTIWHDVTDHLGPPHAIFENVMRAACAVTVDGAELQGFTWTNDTQALGYGEAMVARLSVGPFPILDFAPLTFDAQGPVLQTAVLRPGE